MSAGIALAWNGVVAVIAGVLVLAVPLSGQVAEAVRPRSRELRDGVLRRLAELRPLRADEIIETHTHDPFSTVGALLSGYRSGDADADRELEQLRETIQRVGNRLHDSELERDSFQSGVPSLIGGLATPHDGRPTVKLYGDPANVPDWVSSPIAREGITIVGRVLDDVRHLHSKEIEWVVLTFTLYARALLLVLTPALGSLTSTSVPDLDRLTAADVPWLLACVWAVVTALRAPGLATSVMTPSRRGARTRRLLLAVELPLASAVAITCPAWTSVAFAAGWTNWWQRVSRGGGDIDEIPDFSWPRLAGWGALVVGCQAAGFVIDPAGPAALPAAAEIAATLVVIAVIGGSYGAMFPVSAGMLGRVLARGISFRQESDREAEAVINEVAARMTSAADALARLDREDEAAAGAEELLRRSTRELLAERQRATRHPGAQTLDALLTAALAEGGYDMWADDPRALSARQRAERAGTPLPVLVQRPTFDPDQEAFGSLRLAKRDGDTLRRLVIACVVEARAHGTRRVETIARLAGDRVEIRIANEPRPGPGHRGRGRGGKRIRELALALPGADEPFRGPTTRAFVDKPGSLELFGVRFSFTLSDGEQ